MKTVREICYVFTFFYLLLSLVSCKSGKNAGSSNLTNEYTITLYVNTMTLNQQKPEDACRFTVDPKEAKRKTILGHKVRDFKVKIKLDGNPKSVNWVAVSEGISNKKVGVSKIVHTGGNNTFGINPIGGENGKVSAEPKTKTKLFSDYKYDLYFTVGNSPVEYIIDPKLMVK